MPQFICFLKNLKNKLRQRQLYERILMALEGEISLTDWFTFLKGFFELLCNTGEIVVDPVLYFVDLCPSLLFTWSPSLVVKRNCSLKVLYWWAFLEAMWTMYFSPGNKCSRVTLPTKVSSPSWVTEAVKKSQSSSLSVSLRLLRSSS